MDLRQSVFLHVSVEEIGMRSTRWAPLSSGRAAQYRSEGGLLPDLQHTQR